MTIELLDIRKTWSKIKAGFGNSRLFQNPPPRPTHPFKDGVDMTAATAQQGVGGQPKESVFGGKTYSERRKK